MLLDQMNHKKVKKYSVLKSLVTHKPKLVTKIIVGDGYYNDFFCRIVIEKLFLAMRWSLEAAGMSKNV